jgi:hypothetical protein
MKKIIKYSAMIILVAFTRPLQQPIFQQLHSLTGGVWVMKTKNGFLAERWDKINDSLLRNQAYKIVGTDTTLLEHVELNRIGAEINYISLVANENNGQAVLFKLTESKNGQFIFSNPQHDFPQRIIYHLISKDSLHAWIDGKLNGKEIKKDFYYTRVY